jgi:hypothetical protein
VHVLEDATYYVEVWTNAATYSFYYVIARFVDMIHFTYLQFYTVLAVAPGVARFYPDAKGYPVAHGYAVAQGHPIPPKSHPVS